MIPKSIPLACYESSLLSATGIPLMVGWQAIATEHQESEVKALFESLAKDMQNGSPSLKPFEEHLSEDSFIASHFAELAANTGMFDRFWSDMAFAFLLKKKLETRTPTAADGTLALYLLSFGDNVVGTSLKEEMDTWSESPDWKAALEKSPSPDAIFPEAWWQDFTIDEKRIAFPPTITTFLTTYFQTGMLSSLPSMELQWSRFLQAIEQLY